jgi:hypothetical protein
MDYRDRTYITVEGLKAQPCSDSLSIQLQASLAEPAIPFAKHDWVALIQTYPVLQTLDLQAERHPTSSVDHPDRQWKVICRPQLIVDLAECTIQMEVAEPARAQRFLAIAQAMLTLPSPDPRSTAQAVYPLNEAALAQVYAQTIPDFSEYQLFYTLYTINTWVSTMFYEREYTDWYLEGLRLLRQD